MLEHPMDKWPEFGVGKYIKHQKSRDLFKRFYGQAKRLPTYSFEESQAKLSSDLSVIK